MQRFVVAIALHVCDYIWILQSMVFLPIVRTSPREFHLVNV